MRKRIAALFFCLCLTMSSVALCEAPGIDPRAVPDDGPPSAEYVTIDPQTGERVYETRISIRNGIEPGMTRDEVIEREGQEPVVMPNGFDRYTRQDVAGTEADLVYYYGWGKLYLFGYRFTERDSAKAKKQYEQIEKSLSFKYGDVNCSYEKLIDDAYGKTTCEDKDMLDYCENAETNIRMLENGYIIHAFDETGNNINHNLLYYSPDILPPVIIRGI